VVIRADVGGDAGDAVVGAGFSVGVPVPAAERGFDLAGADAGRRWAVQVRQDGPADVAGQVAAGIGDIRGSGEEVLAGLDGGLVAARSGSVPGTDWTASATAVRSAW
jgi:hypothetical protein